jgi:hypothetical protein
LAQFLHAISKIEATGMRTSNQIGNSHEDRMNLILKFILEFDVNKLLYAINGKQLREDEIISLTADIRDYHEKLRKQKIHLFDFGKTFNKEFATNDNKCFDTNVKISRKMRSGLVGIRDKIFKPFVKVTRKKLPNGCQPPQLQERSMISTNAYSADLFGLSSYPECVKELFKAMLEFYEDLDDCISEGMRILNEEKEVKQDKRHCLQCLINACEKSRKAQLHIIEAAQAEPDLKEALMKSVGLNGNQQNPVLNAFKKDSMSEMFATAYFHNCLPSDIGKITLYRTWSESEEDPMMMMATTIFGNDKAKIKRINYIIRHFDTLLPNVCKRSQIPAYRLFVFMEWCGPIMGIDSFLNYFNKYYLEHGGKWKTIGKSAINGAKNRPYKSSNQHDYNQERSEMLNAITSLLNENDLMAASA